MTDTIDINDTASDRGRCILAVIAITHREADYFFGDVPLSVEAPEEDILIYKRKP